MDHACITRGMSFSYCSYLFAGLGDCEALCFWGASVTSLHSFIITPALKRSWAPLRLSWAFLWLSWCTLGCCLVIRMFIRVHIIIRASMRLPIVFCLLIWDSIVIRVFSFLGLLSQFVFFIWDPVVILVCTWVTIVAGKFFRVISGFVSLFTLLMWAPNLMRSLCYHGPYRFSRLFCFFFNWFPTVISLSRLPSLFVFCFYLDSYRSSRFLCRIPSSLVFVFGICSLFVFFIWVVFVSRVFVRVCIVTHILCGCIPLFALVFVFIWCPFVTRVLFGLSSLFPF